MIKEKYFAFGAILEKILKIALIVVSGIMVISVFLQVLLRSGLNISILQIEDIAKYSFVWLVFLSTSYLFMYDGHVAITFFVSEVSSENTENSGLHYENSCLFFLSAVIVYGISFVKNGMSEYLSQLRIRAGWMYSVIPISFSISLYGYVGYLLGWKKPKELEEVNSSSV